MRKWEGYKAFIFNAKKEAASKFEAASKIISFYLSLVYRLSAFSNLRFTSFQLITFQNADM